MHAIQSYLDPRVAKRPNEAAVWPLFYKKFMNLCYLILWDRRSCRVQRRMWKGRIRWPEPLLPDIVGPQKLPSAKEAVKRPDTMAWTSVTWYCRTAEVAQCKGGCIEAGYDGLNLCYLISWDRRSYPVWRRMYRGWIRWPEPLLPDIVGPQKLPSAKEDV